MHKVIVLTHCNPAYEEAMTKLKLPDLKILPKKTLNLPKADIWLAEPHIAAPLLPKGKVLKWIQSTFAGVDILLKKEHHQDIQLTRIKQIFGPMISEYVFSYILSRTRQHYHYRQLQRHRRWQTLPYEPLSEKNMLILGTGDIGKHLCETANHFGLNTVGVNRNGNCPKPFKKTVNIHKLDQHLPTADIVVCCLPSTDETKGLFDAKRLGLLKSTSLFINIGRGDLVNHQALLLHLSLNPASHAVLDVFEQEPLKETHPIWQCPNATITPHVAAPSQIKDVIEQFAENYLRFLKNEPLINKVDKEIGY